MKSHLKTKYQRLFEVHLGVLNQYAPFPLVNSAIYMAPKVEVRSPSKISIVTPSFQQASFIERTINSVISQQYPLLEYYIQDGGSTDGTLEILEKYSHLISGFESITDRGQSNAINLAFSRTSGEIMAWLNSDDLLMPGTLNYVAEYFHSNPGIDVIYGNRLLIDENDHQIGHWVFPKHDQNILKWADFIPQETLFWRRRIWDKVGAKIDEGFSFAMDWDLILRFQEAGAKFSRIPYFLGAFRIHTKQKTSSVINEVGIYEMNKLRARSLGYIPTAEEIDIEIKPYIKKHILFNIKYTLYKKIMGLRRKC